MSQEEPPLFYLKDQIWNSNQVLIAILGICSALGVTSRLSVAITMGLSVVFVTGFSSLFVSFFRHQTPDSVRMITQLAIISVFVTIIDNFLRAYFFDIAKVLSVFVGLIITNCIVMGRAESMAKNVSPLPAFLDGAGAGFGYAWVLCIVAAIREFFGFGQLFGQQIIPKEWYMTTEFPSGYQDAALMISAPAAFFIIGGMIWITNLIGRKKGA